MAAEAIVLDDSAVADARTELDISAWVDVEGIDWGDSEIVAYQAEGERGSAPVDFRVPNRQVSIPLVLRTVGATTFATIRAQIQAKAALMQREGGWLKRVLSDGTSTYYLDIVNATLKLSGGWMQAHRDADIDAVLTLEAIPDFYGDEVTLTDHAETTLACLVFTDTDIDGDYPARARLVVDEDDADDQMFLMYGVQCRNYSSAANAALFFGWDYFTPLGGATSSAGLVRQDTLTTTYQAMLSTQASGGGAHMSHVGTFRVWVRTYRPPENTGEVSVALEWGEGDFRKRTTNAPAFYEVNDREGTFCLTDLGLVSLRKVAQGTQRWEGRIVAKSTVAGDDLHVMCLFLMPVDEGYGEIRGLSQFETPTSFTARDEFDQAAGALTGKTAPVGGVWAGAGDASDFTVETTGKTAERAATSDADINTGRYAISGVAGFAAQVAQVDVKTSKLWGGPAEFRYMGVLARYVDVSNWLMATLDAQASGATLVVRKRVAGTVTTLATVDVDKPAVAVFRRLRLSVDAAGRWQLWYFAASGSPDAPVASGVDSVLATGGALASGKPGFYDALTGATATTRNYDNFQAFTPIVDAAMFASQSLEIRHDRVIREDSAGAIWTPVSDPKGDYLRLPPSGLEDRPARIILKGSRNDPDTGTDPATDNISARVYYRPSWLTVPGS